MKRYLLFVLASLMLVSLTAGCGGGTKKVTLPPGVNGDIAVLFLGADTTGLTDDQIKLLQSHLTHMDKKLIEGLNSSGFTAGKIKNAKDFKGKGHLLKVSITKHKIVPNGARIAAGMMAGADILTAQYELNDTTGKTVLSWEETQASARSVYYCAKSLNRSTINKIASYLGGS